MSSNTNKRFLFPFIEVSFMKLWAVCRAIFGIRKYSALDMVVSSPPTLKKQARSFCSGDNDSKPFLVLFFERPTYMALLFPFSNRNWEIVLIARLVLPRLRSPLKIIKLPWLSGWARSRRAWPVNSCFWTKHLYTILVFFRVFVKSTSYSEDEDASPYYTEKGVFTAPKRAFTLELLCYTVLKFSEP